MVQEIIAQVPAGVAETEPENDGTLIELTEDISLTFRSFERDIRMRKYSVYHSANISSHTKNILQLGEKGMALIVIHLLETDAERTDDDEMVFYAWCVVFDWMAEDLKLEDAPVASKDIHEWVDYVSEYIGLYTKDVEDENQTLQAAE